jgi:N-acetylneuraminic acid mutarotase/glucose/arabinose dehydrogenase
MASQLAPSLFAVLAALPGAAQAPAGGAPQEQSLEVRPAPPLDVGPNLVFGSLPVGATSTGQVVTIQNTSAAVVTVTLVRLAGDDPDSYLLMSQPTTPFQLLPGQKQQVGVKFHPLKAGGHEAYLRVETATAPALAQSALLVGVGLGPTGDEVLINAGGGDYSSSSGQLWPADFGFLNGIAIQGGPFAYGTPDPELYRDQRQGAFFAYALPLADGTYSVALHFAELQVPFAGARVFDVRAEGATVIDNLDLAGQVGFGKAHVEVRDVTVSDGLLQLEFQASAGQALVSAIEVHGLAQLAAEPSELDFGAVASGATGQLPVLLENHGVLTADLTSLSLKLGPAGTPEAMSVEAFGQRFTGAPGDSTYGLDATLAPGASAPLLVKFSPTTDQYDECQLVLEGNFPPLTVKLVGLGGHEGDPYLHVVIETDPVLVDYDGNGSESAVLDGSLSHTHEPGKSLTGYAWSEGATALASGPVTVQTMALGKHTVSLKITDDSVPPKSYSGSAPIEVVTSSAVPGVLASYYDASDGPETPLSLLAAPPAQADFAEIVPGLSLTGLTSIGTSPYAADVMVRFQAKVDLPQAGTYDFVAGGASARVVLLEGFVVPGPVFLPAGAYKLDARFAVDGAGALPLEVKVGIDGGPLGPVAAAWLDHDESQMAPLITAMPSVGTTLGGNQINIDGLGFFPASQVVVHWGALQLAGSSLQSLAPDEIVLVSPPGSGVIQVQVETPNGFSNPVSFTYDASGPVPINFAQQPSISVHAPTAGVWGPDQRFYVGCQDGRITAFQFDDAYHVVGQTTYAGVSALDNHDLLGIALNPWDPPSPVRLYVAHGHHFVSGGTSFTGPSPYTGQVSVLTGPTFDQPEPLITQLPTSNHDHAVNGLDFDNNGDLLICVGSNTNAGVKHPLSGDLVESPLSAAILKAETSKPDFDGHIHYLLSDSGLESTDQVDGEIVDVAPGCDVHVQAPGVRNAYELVYTTSGKLYVADNGPNTGFGAASTGPTTEGPHPYEQDEVLLIEYDNYYGHPNRSRGRYDARQNIYRNGTEPSIPGEFVQAMALQNSSLDGLDEYRANTFQGQMRGDLIAQRMGTYAYRVRLSDDGRSVLSCDQLGEWSGALGVVALPGGAFVSLAQGLDWMHVYLPNDLSAVGLKVFDVFPWRGPETGGTPFVLGGVGFGTLANTSVRFDGIPAVLTSVSPTRIRGVTPSDSHHGGSPVTISVKVGIAQSSLPDAFRYLFPPGQELGTWENLPNLPTNLGEVAAGIINGVVYVVGSGSGSTLRYSIAGHAWLSSGATRPFPGDHHAAEVVNGKLYLIGGLEAGSEGKVQIYDPVANQWSLGTPMPWAAGSVCTTVINGKIHAAGGIVGSTTVANHSVYDPAFGTWSPKAPMPLGRNHTAAGTDGTRFYVFGGRDGGNFVTNGFDDVQIYNPATNSWQWSKDGVSGLKPLPQYRGGMGKAVYYQGEFYVFGGETATGPGAVAGGVYDRVDVYRPTTNTWRLEKKMPHPRHGIFPVLYQSRMLLPGGGVMAGSSSSNIFDVFTRQ